MKRLRLESRYTAFLRYMASPEDLWKRTSPEGNWDSQDNPPGYSGDIEELLKDFYRLEYVYSSLKNKPFSGNEKRQQNIFNRVKASFKSVAEELREVFVGVFEEWLSKHAITNPGQWGQARVYKENWDDMHSMVDSMVWEYYRYKDGGKWHLSLRDKFSDFSEKVFEALFRLPEVSNFSFEALGGEDAVSSEVQMYVEEYESDPEETLERLGLSLELSVDSVEQEIERVVRAQMSDPEYVVDRISNFGFTEFVNMLENTLGVNGLQELIAIGYEKLVFPLWYSFWSEKGIDDTRARVFKATADMKSAKTLEEMYAAVNVATTVSHQSGEMLEYVEEYTHPQSGGLSKLLDELTAGEFTEGVDVDLREVGVQL
jgi:hypothetical protein